MRQFLLVTGVLILLAGCASTPEPVPTGTQEDWLAHRDDIAALRSWDLSGRIAVSNEDQGWSAQFDWRQREDRFHIRLRGPLGQGAVELLGDTRGVHLLQPGKPTVSAPSAELLLEQQTGWRLPVSGLQFWLRGLPVPGVDSDFQVDVQGRLIDLRQYDWTIDYKAYQETGPHWLPQRMKLEDPSLRVKFVVDQWRLI